MRNKVTGGCPACALGAILGLGASSAAVAQDNWAWSAEVYGWMPTISGQTSSGSKADLNFDTILDELNFTFMGNLATKRDRWTLYADLIYLNISDRDKGTLQIGTTPVSGELNWKISTSIASAGAAYEVSSTDHSHFNVLGGVQYLWMDTDIALSVGSKNGEISDKETYVDAFVGINGSVNLNKRWYFSYYADIGTGQSDLTWQALAALSYRIDKWDLAVGYRHLDWKFSDGPLDELTVSGPYIGARFTF